MRVLLAAFLVLLWVLSAIAQPVTSQPSPGVSPKTPIRSGTSAQTPTTCLASKELWIKTDATPGQQLFICNAAGNGFVLVGDGAAGVGTVTSVGTAAPLTGGPITGAGTITCPTAAGGQAGCLSAADWTAFNAKGTVTSVATGSGLTGGPITTTGTVSCLSASGAQFGCLSAADWTTFNAKQPPGNYLIDPGSNGLVTRTGLNTTTAFQSPDKKILGNMSGATATATSINPAALVSTNYAFPAQTPNVGLSAGVPATITLAPVPAGVNGADVSHTLYVSGGVGTAEAVLITGGSAVSGAASGTLTFTPANNHSGAWTIASASAGIREALQQGGAKGVVRIPGGNHTLYAKLVIPFIGSLRGAGVSQTFLLWNTGYTDRAIEAAVSNFDFGDLSMLYLTIGTVNEGVYLSGVSDSNITNLSISQSWNGITAVGGCFRDTFYNINLFQYNDAFQIGQGVVTIDTVRANMNGVTTGIALHLGFSNQETETMVVNNFNSDGGAVGIQFDSSSNNMIQLTVTNSQFDSCHTACLFITPSGTATANSWHFSNVLFSTSASSIFSQVVLLQTAVVNGINQFSFNGCRFLAAGAFASGGISLNGGVNGFKLSNSIIMSNSGSLGASIALSIGGGVNTDIYIGAGNVIGVGQFVEKGANAFTSGIVIDAHAHTNVKIVGNSLIYGSTTPFSTAGTAANGVSWLQNGGVDDVMGAVASGATITAPVNQTSTVTGVTTITTINGGFIGRKITLVFTDAAPGGVATGGNIARTVTAAQNHVISLTYNGTTWYPEG